MMGDNPANSWTKAIYTPNDLTNEDAAVVDRYFNYGLVQIQRLQKNARIGTSRRRLGKQNWLFRLASRQRGWAALVGIQQRRFSG